MRSLIGLSLLLLAASAAAQTAAPPEVVGPLVGPGASPVQPSLRLYGVSHVALAWLTSDRNWTSEKGSATNNLASKTVPLLDRATPPEGEGGGMEGGMMGGMMAAMMGGMKNRGGMMAGMGPMGGMMGGMGGRGQAEMMAGMMAGMMGGRGMMGTDPEAQKKLVKLTRTDFLLQFLWKPVEPTPAPEPEPEEEGGLPSWLLYVAFGIGNIIVLAGGYWLFRKLTKDNSEAASLSVADIQMEMVSPSAMSMDGLAMDDEQEPPMEDLTDDDPEPEDEIPALHDVVTEEDLRDDLVEQVMGGETEEAKEDFAAEIRRVQGLDMDEDELDDAISNLIDELDGEPRSGPNPAELDDMNIPDEDKA